MEYSRVAGVDDLREGDILPVVAAGRKLFLTMTGGQYRAGDRKCPHLGFNLCRGKVEDGAIVCLLHKAAFDLDSGQVRRDPKLLFIGMKAKNNLSLYPVKVEGTDILVGV